MTQRGTFAALWLVVLALCLSPLSCVAAEDPEDEMKAAVVLGFLRYSEWPPQASRGPIVIGVAGRTSFTAVLKGMLEGKTANGRSIKVLDLTSSSDPGSCHVLYVASNRAQSSRLNGKSPRELTAVLTIGDGKDFLDSGGIVRLLLVDGRMSFEVSLEALERSGLVISSKLLRLGQVHGRLKGAT